MEVRRRLLYGIRASTRHYMDSSLGVKADNRSLCLLSGVAGWTKALDRRRSFKMHERVADTIYFAPGPFASGARL